MIGHLSIAAAAVAGAFAQPAAASAPVQNTSRPAIWVVNDEDTVIYLFGTFHALDGRSRWFNAEVKTALGASDELILETLVPEPPPVPAPAPVRPKAGGEDSFLSTSSMVMAAGRARGMSTDKGADAVLRHAAEQAGKKVAGLESFEAQLDMFSRMPPAAMNHSRAQAPAVSVAVSGLLADLQDAWGRGDIEKFAPMLEQMRAGSPQTYNLLFRDRNARWAGWIAERLREPGVVFVAVGAGHLSGQDSVQRKLAQFGIRSARIN